MPRFRGAPSGFFKGCPQGRPSVDEMAEGPAQEGVVGRHSDTYAVLAGRQHTPQDRHTPRRGHSLCLCPRSTHRTPQRGSHGALELPGPCCGPLVSPPGGRPRVRRPTHQESDQPRA